MKGAMQKIQRFGGAMFTPVLLFGFSGIMVGLSTLFLNASIFGEIATEGHFWHQIWYLVREGAWKIPCIVGKDGYEKIAQGKIPRFRKGLMESMI